MKSLSLIRPTLVGRVALGLIILLASRTEWLCAQNGPQTPAPQESVAPAQAGTTTPVSASAGPRSVSEAEANLQQGHLTVWVPRSFVRGMDTLPASERYHDYDWEGLKKAFKTDFPNFDLRLQEYDLGQFIRLMHSSPPDVHFPDVAFLDNIGDLRPLLKGNVVVEMWGRTRLQYLGWWVAFRQSRNFAAGESFLLWASQRFHWTPWSVSTNTIDAMDATTVQELSQRAVQDFAKGQTESLWSTLDADAARFEILRPERVPFLAPGPITVLSTEPLVTFGNSRLAFVLMGAVGEGAWTFGMAHFGLILRKTEAGWKVWYFLPDRALPDLEKLFQSFDHLGLEEAGAQPVPKVTLIPPADNTQPASSSRPDIEWSTVDAPLATYVIEFQYPNPYRNRGAVSWGPSTIELVSPISVGPSIRKEAPSGAVSQPRRWRVWAISKAGIISTSDWRVIEPAGAAPGSSPGRAAPVAGTTTNLGQHPAPDVVAAADPPCMEWVMAAERGQPMIAPRVTIRYNPRAPGAHLASAQSLTLVIASQQGPRFNSIRVPMTRAADGTWQAEFSPERNYVPGYAIFFFEDEKRRLDNRGGQYWDILNCYRGEPDPFSVGAQAWTYQGQLLAPGIQRPPDLARALAILKDDLTNYPGHYVQDDFHIWTYELKVGAESPAAYEQVGREVDSYIADHGSNSRAMHQLCAFIGPNQQKLPSGVVQRFRRAVTALPETAGASDMIAELDYGLLWSEGDEQKRAQGYLAFAAKYPHSRYANYAYQYALASEIKMKDVSGAESVFEKLAALERESPEPLLTMSEFYVDQKTKVDRAVKLLDTADALLTENQAHYAADLLARDREKVEFLRGQAYLLLDDLPHARTHLEAAAQATPDKPKTLYALGEVREKMGDMDAALDAYLSAASAPYQENSAPHDAYLRLFVAQRRGKAKKAEQKILDRISQNTKQASAQYTPIAMNRPAPEFAFVDLAGKRFDGQTAKGKPTILNFWGIWCAACVTEMPALQEFQKQHPDANLLAVEIGNRPDEVKSFLSAHNLNTLRVAVKETMPAEFGAGGFPNTFVIDRFGQIQFIHAGLLPNVEATLGKDLEALPTPEH